MRFDYILASLLIFIGLTCLAMSGTFLSGINVQDYIYMFILLCILIGIPLMIVGIILLFIKKGKGKGD